MRKFPRRAQMTERVVVLMTPEELTALRQWGVSANMSSQGAAIRELLKLGLQAVAAHEVSRGAAGA